MFLDEIDLGALHQQGRLALALVDHNSLALSQRSMGTAVETIIDHHKWGSSLTPLFPKRLTEVCLSQE